MNEVPILYKNKEKCCGCTACLCICPRAAIIMKADEDGFEYPIIDSKRCVQCHMCITVCPLK